MYNNTTDVKVDFCLAVDKKMIEIGACGHADQLETSLMLFYDSARVDVTTLPPKGTPFYYKDYSIVDGAGFTSHHDPEHVMRNDDPRDSTAQQGKDFFEAAVEQMKEQITKFTA
jgi:creatinine amidohydrolase/Fe(II)-dependent formamide hydrolase-like protein